MVAMAGHPAQASQEEYALPDPSNWEGARPGHYADYFAQQLAEFDFDAAFKPERPQSPFGSFDERERLRTALGLINHLTDIARAAPDPQIACSLLDPVLGAIDQDRIVAFHVAYRNWGPDGYEAQLLATLGRTYETRIRGCISQHGANHARTRAVTAERDAFYAAFAAHPPEEQTPYDGDGADPIAFDLLGNQHTALAMGDRRAAAMYRSQASDRIAYLEASGLLTDYIARLDSFTGVNFGMEAPETRAAESRLSEESLDNLRCQQTMIAAISRGVGHASFWQGDTGTCPNEPGTVGVSSAYYYELANVLAGGLFTAGQHHDASQLARAYPPLLATRDALRAVEEEDRQRSPGIRYRTGASDEMLRLQRRLLDAMWYAQQENPAPTLAEEAFRILQHVNTSQAIDGIAMGSARARASDLGLGPLLDELEEINKNDFDEVFRPRIRVNNPTLEATPEFQEEERERARVRQAFDRRIEIFAQIEREFPEYFSLTLPSQLSLEETQALLGPDEAIFLYLPNIMGSHGFLVTADAHQWLFDEGGSDAASRAATKLLWDVFADVPIPDEVDAFWADEADGKAVYSRGVAYDLYRRTLGRHEALLEGKTRIFTLTNTGGLANLPFAMLVTEEPEGSDSDPDALRATAWLGAQFELGKLPTLQTLKILRERGSGGGSPAIDSLFGIGDPALGGSAQDRGVTDRRARLAQVRAARDLSNVPFAEAPRLMSRLSGTRKELEAVASEFGGTRATILIGEEATETALRGSVLSDADLLVFATHGVMAKQLGGLNEAALILSPLDGAIGPESDGVLTASEISGLDLGAQWAVLSACNTATGEFGGAPGLSGLSRAFFYAGVESILASLWPVDDTISPQLTVGTITGQREGLTRGAALLAAMRDVREDKSYDEATMSYAHPMYWAPFVLIGDVAD